MADQDAARTAPSLLPLGERLQSQDPLLHNPLNAHGPSSALNHPLLPSADEEKALYIPPATQRSRFFSELKHPTWRFWTALIVAIMFLSVLVIGSTLLALSHKHAVAAVPMPGKSKTTAASGPVVDLGYSQYQGVNQGKTNAWLGMRYAQPPLGDLRFKTPQDPKSTSGVQPANQHGAYCLPSPSTGPTNGASEDCLFLDVMAPSDTSKKHPIYVFIQGGGFNSNASPNMNGSHIIDNGENDIIVVTFNYRVGFLGFLASKEVKSGGNLNVGNLDQRMVLQWVQKHIDKFGGDPKRVTLGGASAGAASVNLQLMAYGGRDDGLFQAAAGESNSFGLQLTIDESQYQYDALVKRVQCDKSKDTLQCLRKLDIKVLAQQNSVQPTPNGGVGNPVFMYSNTIDGDFTQDYTYKSFADGKFIKVPTIFGSDTNEGTIFTPSGINNKSDMHQFLKDNWVKLNSSHFDRIDNYYPEAEHYPGKGNFWKTAANAYGEMRYNCPGIFLNQRFMAAGQRSYSYHWDVLSPGNKANGMGVTHTAEVSSIWGTSTGVEAPQQPIIGKYWASFIRTHDPNTLKDSKAPVWTQYDGNGAGKHVKMHFNTNVIENAAIDIDQALIDKCAYFAGIGPSISQ